MIAIRRADERGHFDFGWLDTNHTFSFGDYYDPNFMGFRTLRVINEDRVKGGEGFGTHPHRDMEIISYVLEGGLAHKDSTGTGSVIRPGDVQRMSAGTGVLHSEQNASKTETAHFLQIWIVPERRGLEPSYEQKHFPESERQGRLRLVASQDGREGSLTVHQDMELRAGLLSAGEKLELPVREGRCLVGRQASWPKGRYSALAGFVEPGESIEEACAREVKEETGMDCVLGAPLPSCRYLAGGRPKEVRYWAAEAGEGTFTPGREVDRLVWLSPGMARLRLTHDRDRPLIDALLRTLGKAA